MKQTVAFFATVAAAALLSYSTPALTQQVAATASVPANIAGAIADANRPQTDKDLDAQRKPAEMLTFAGVKAGDKVLEFVPGRGYVTRLLAKAVGTAGHVYGANLPTFNEAFRTGVDPIIASPAYGNVSKVEQPFSEIRAPEPVDVAWISENYHDFRNMGQFSTDTNAMDRAVFAALKPGGTYVVTDYIAAAGSGTRDTQSLPSASASRADSPSNAIKPLLTQVGYFDLVILHPLDQRMARTGYARVPKGYVVKTTAVRREAPTYLASA